MLNPRTLTYPILTYNKKGQKRAFLDNWKKEKKRKKVIKEIWEFLTNDVFYHQKNRFLDFACILYLQRDPKVHLSLSRERERWVQVTPGVILKSYTFSKPLDLSRSNGKKRHSLMLIFLLGSHLLFRIYDIPYLSLK